MKDLRVIGFTAAIFILLSHVPSGQNSVRTPGAGEMNAHFINVGQGASVLLEFACGAALIDTGGEKNDSFDGTEALETYLDDFFRRRQDLDSRLQMVVISHAHIDHTRGLPMVLDRYEVDVLVDNGLETGSGGRQQKSAHAKARASGSNLTWQSVSQRDGLTHSRRSPPQGTLNCSNRAPRFRFLWGRLNTGDDWSQEILKNGNDSSIVTRLDFGETSFLFPGDLEDDVQEDVVSETCPNGSGRSDCLLDVDIYHVSHHGSHNGTSVELMEAMTPRVAVLSMSPWNRREAWTAYKYGHPRLATMNVLLDMTHGVQDRRPETTVMVAKRAAPREGSTASGSQFSKTTLTRAIYGTGWDEDVVVAAKADGSWRVLTGVGPN